MQTINNYLSNRKYPGRTVIAGNTKDGKLFMAYLLQGRSENSRNRVLVKQDNAIETAPKDESKVQNRDLIILFFLSSKRMKIKHYVSFGAIQR